MRGSCVTPSHTLAAHPCARSAFTSGSHMVTSCGEVTMSTLDTAWAAAQPAQAAAPSGPKVRRRGMLSANGWATSTWIKTSPRCR